uniref:Uncharacterized protein n=1 Tax=viral metagenome TaxID=1070528 RepID=A0A6M3KIM6_9ZZZZ
MFLAILTLAVLVVAFFIFCSLMLSKIRDNCMPGRLDEPRPEREERS